jgi:hypothetical protein
MPIARWRQPQAVLAPDTRLVIDGFTRSAVTFALVAFQVAQNDHVRVAHHLHAPAHLMAAARRGVPALVPIREPEETVLSAMIREPTVSAEQFLRSSVDLYRRLPPLADGLVIATFRSVTEDFRSVTRRVNERFGTSFVEFKQTESQVATVFELIDERARRPPWEPLIGDFLAGRISFDEFRDRTADLRRSLRVPDVPEQRVQRPSEFREEMKAPFRERYEDPALAAWRARAKEAYLAAAAMAK